jgi:hypothetical protein
LDLERVATKVEDRGAQTTCHDLLEEYQTKNIKIWQRK